MLAAGASTRTWQADDGLAVNGWQIERTSYDDSFYHDSYDWCDDRGETEYVLGDDHNIYEYSFWYYEKRRQPLDIGKRLRELTAADLVDRHGPSFTSWSDKIKRLVIIQTAGKNPSTPRPTPTATPPPPSPQAQKSTSRATAPDRPNPAELTPEQRERMLRDGLGNYVYRRLTPEIKKQLLDDPQLFGQLLDYGRKGYGAALDRDKRLARKLLADFGIENRE